MKRMMAVVAAALALGCGRVHFDALGDGDGGAPGDGANPNGLDLESTIEMIGGNSLASDTAAAVTFTRTLTALATTDYDGAVSYFFETVAENDDVTDRDIQLIDGSGAVVATITVVARTLEPTRLRVAFTPAIASTTYVISVSPTPVMVFELTVFDARLGVHQVGATKTRLYYPLLTAPQDQADDSTAPGAGYSSYTNANVFTQGTTPAAFVQWQKPGAQLATLAADTPWTFDALLSCPNPGHHVSAALFDTTAGHEVVATEVETDGAGAALERETIDFADASVNFTAGDNFAVEFHNDDNAADSYVYKAGLWVRLVDLSAAEVVLHIGGILQTGGITADARALLDASAFSNPTIAFEAVGSGGGATLVDDSSNDTGSSGEPLATTTVTFTPGASRQRTALLALTSGDRYYAQSTSPLTSATLVIDVNR